MGGEGTYDIVEHVLDNVHVWQSLFMEGHVMEYYYFEQYNITYDVLYTYFMWILRVPLPFARS